MNSEAKPKVVLMSYAMDNRKSKGIALYTRKLIEGLLEDEKFDYYLAHFDKVDDPIYKKTKEILMPRVRLPYGSRFISLMLFFWKYRKESFDIVHWFHPRVYPFFWFVPARKIIVTVHGAGDITAPSHFVFSRTIFNFVLKNFHKYIDEIIVVSNFAKKEVVDNYGFPPEKVEVVYNGGGEIYKPLDKGYSQKLVLDKYKIDGNYILDVSRLQPHKNIVTLIEAYGIMRKENPERLEKLVIVGDTAYNTTDEYDARERSLFINDIIFISFVPGEDLNAIYSGANLFAFPSLNEGFGLPVLEAMASGTPVITSNITSMPEIGGESVVTVDPLDKEVLAREMSRVLQDGDLRVKMIESGLSRAKEFTWRKTVEATENLYKKII